MNSPISDFFRKASKAVLSLPFLRTFFISSGKEKGYVYTALTIGLILLSLSLISFYFTVSRREIDNSLTRISLEELHYKVDNVKEEYSKVLEDSGRRAATYAISYILNSSENLKDYEMQPCNEFVYPLKGSQAAITELMLCGTLFGERRKEMTNNTLLNWTQKVEDSFKGGQWNLDLKIRNITLVLPDAWNFAVFSVIELSAGDKENLTQVRGNISITGVVPITGLEDPLYYLKTNESDVIRKFQKCDDSEKVDGSTINDWIESQCYHSSNLSYNGSSFFDRLEGKLNLSPCYVEQHKKYFSSEEIGLESFLDAHQLFLHNLTQYEQNYTWVDYLFWQKIMGKCTVDGTKEYDENGKIIKFWIDLKHKEKYDILGATCG